MPSVQLLGPFYHLLRQQNAMALQPRSPANELPKPSVGGRSKTKHRLQETQPHQYSGMYIFTRALNLFLLRTPVPSSCRYPSAIQGHLHTSHSTTHMFTSHLSPTYFRHQYLSSQRLVIHYLLMYDSLYSPTLDFSSFTNFFILYSVNLCHSY